MTNSTIAQPNVMFAQRNPVFERTGSFWWRWYGETTAVLNGVLLLAAFVHGLTVDCFAFAALMLIGISIMSMPRLTQVAQQTSKIAGLGAYVLALLASQDLHGENQIGWITFFTLLCTVLVIGMSNRRERRQVARICACAAFVYAIYIMCIAATQPSEVPASLSFFLIAWCSLGVLPLALMTPITMSAPSSTRASLAVLLATAWALPAAYVMTNMMALFFSVELPTTAKAFVLIVTAGLGVVCNIMVLKKVETSREAAFGNVMSEQAKLWESTFTSPTMKAFEQGLYDELSSKTKLVKRLQHDLEMARDRSRKIEVTQSKLEQVRAACATIDELTAVLKHRDEYDACQPVAGQSESGDFTITYLQLRIYDALTSVSTGTNELLNNLESLMQTEPH